jgi:hypothetical protein
VYSNHKEKHTNSFQLILHGEQNINA